MGKDWSTMSSSEYYTSHQLQPTLRPKIKVSKLGFFYVVCTWSNCTQL